jgi:hypothetical protein
LAKSVMRATCHARVWRERSVYGAAFAVLLVAVMAWWYGSSRASTPEGVMSSFMAASVRGDAKAQDALGIVPSRFAMAPASGASHWIRGGNRRRAMTYTIGTASVTGDTATVPVRITDTGILGADTLSLDITLMRVGGVWRVDPPVMKGGIGDNRHIMPSQLVRLSEPPHVVFIER